MFIVRDLKRVYLHTLEWYSRAQSCFARCGFNPVRNVRRMGHDFILMEVLRTDWQQKGRQLLDDRWRYLREKGGEEVLPETSGSSSL